MSSEAKRGDEPVPRPGDVIAEKFVVEEVLGAGAMGVVVAARSIALKRRVAIKLVKQGSDDRFARFEREAVALAAFQNDHVVRVLDYGTDGGGTPYLAMEYLVGNDLTSELKARGHLSIDEAVDCVLETCVGLDEAHALGIVHRDIKPSNLFLVRRGEETPRVKILDFGISKMQSPDGMEQSLTDTSTILGSPAYMSPEQIRFSKRVDHRTDIWSLGVVLHRLLTGGQPFVAESFSALCVAVSNDAAPPLRRERPEVPRALESAVLRCLEKEADRRFQTIGELAAALAPFASGRGKAAASRIAVQKRRPEPALVRTAAAQTSSAAESEETRPLGNHGGSLTRTVPPYPTRRAKSSRVLLGAGSILALVAVGAFVVYLAARPGSVPSVLQASDGEASPPSMAAPTTVAPAATAETAEAPPPASTTTSTAQTSAVATEASARGAALKVPPAVRPARSKPAPSAPRETGAFGGEALRNRN